MKIYGAGMAGLLAANMLRRFDPKVYEAQPELPNNHAALLRFRTNACAEATGIPFKKVTVHKAIWYRGRLLTETNLAMNNMYSLKVTGRCSDRSILNLAPVERYIAPPDFISSMAKMADIVYDSSLSAEEILSRAPESEPLVSTVPMPEMMDLCAYDSRPMFGHRPVWSLRVKVSDCDVYQTVYFPGEEELCYRASFTGDLLTIEAGQEIAGFVPELIEDVFGITGLFKVVDTKMHPYGKLIYTAPEACRRFVIWLTDKYRIYSLGRFATWRQLLLDDIVKDVKVIERLITLRAGKDDYQHNLEVAAR